MVKSTSSGDNYWCLNCPKHQGSYKKCQDLQHLLILLILLSISGDCNQGATDTSFKSALQLLIAFQRELQEHLDSGGRSSSYKVD